MSVTERQFCITGCLTRYFVAQANWNDLVIADSAETREVGGYCYFPRASVRMDLLRAAPRNASDLACPHGVQFYDLHGDGQSSPRAAWSYEAPREAMRPVDHWIGFWRDVTVG
jgi:uncharacterized protein (DUF427 family)